MGQVFTSVSGNTVTIRVVIDSADVAAGASRWEVVMSSKTDHGLGSTGVPDYPYYIDHLVSTGSSIFTRTLIPDQYVVELALVGQGVVDFSEFVIAAPVACNLISNCGFAINADSAVLGKGSCNGPLIRGRLYSVAWVVDSNATGPFHVELWSNYQTGGTKDGQGDISGNSGYFNATFNEPVGNYIFNLFITSCGKTAQCGYNTTCSISELSGGNGGGGTGTGVIGSITVDKTASVQVGKTVTLTAICKDTNGNVMTCPSLMWQSDHEDIAKVSAGVITGVSAGTANIIVKDSITSQIVSNAGIATTVTVKESINLNDWLQTETCLDKTNKKYCAKNWMWGLGIGVGLVLLTRKKG